MSDEVSLSLRKAMSLLDRADFNLNAEYPSGMRCPATLRCEGKTIRCLRDYKYAKSRCRGVRHLGRDGRNGLVTWWGTDETARNCLHYGAGSYVLAEKQIRRP